MGFMDKLQQLVQPYDDESRDGDFFDGSGEELRPAAPTSSASEMFESAFGAGPMEAPEPAAKKPARETGDGSLLGSLGLRKQSAAKPKTSFRERTVDVGGTETSVVLFNPRTFDEAGALAGHIQAGRCALMSMEGVSEDNARRLLDFLSGIAFALQWKITPISSEAYFVSPRGMDLFGRADDGADFGGQRL